MFHTPGKSDIILNFIFISLFNLFQIGHTFSLAGAGPAPARPRLAPGPREVPATNEIMPPRHDPPRLIDKFGLPEERENRKLKLKVINTI